MAISFALVIIAMVIITIIKPLQKPVVLPEKGNIDLTSTPVVKWLGMIIVVITLILYIIFW